MINYFLNDTPVQEPAGMAGLYLERELSPRFRGQLYDQRSRAAGVGSVRLQDPDGIDLLLALNRADSLEARAEFRAETGAGLLLRADVDFGSLRRYRNREIEFALHDGDSARLIQNLDQPYDLALTQQTRQPAPMMGTNYELTVDPDRLKVIRAGGAPPGSASFWSVSPAFNVDSKDSTLSGQLLEVPDDQVHAFYRNTTGAPLVLSLSTRLTGQIRASESVRCQSKVIVRDAGGLLVWDVLLGEMQLTANVALPFAVLEDLSLRIPVDATVSIVLEALGWSRELELDWDKEAAVVLSEGDGEPMVLPALSVHDALSELVRLSSGGQLSFRSDYFAGRPIYLTPYGAVRGRDQPLSLSLGGLFDDLNALYGLRAYKSGTVIRIESFTSLLRSVQPYPIRQLADYTIDTDFPRLYRSVRLGFEHWKARNDAGLPEPFAPLTLETGLPSAKQEMDLRCKQLLVSRRMLAEAWQQRLAPDARTSNQDHDARAFLLDPDLTPTTALLSWIPLLGSNHRQLSQVAGEGTWANEPLAPLDLAATEPCFLPDLMQVQCTISTEEFYAIGDFVEIRDLDQRYVIYVQHLTHRPYKGSGEHNTTLEGPILNPTLFR